MAKKLRVKNVKNYALFNYTPYLSRKDKPLKFKPKECPYDIGDVVVELDELAIGVVLGCICDDGELRTDADGMRSWSTLRPATIKDFKNKNLRCSDKLKEEFLNKGGK